jgi:peptide alpha-N-acetyltransferase
MSTPPENNPQAGAGRPLPKKEADLFRNVVKHYEMKQYKKAIKQADTILKKFPNHGETLAMKGLTLHYMSKSQEAEELVKLGLRNDLRYGTSSSFGLDSVLSSFCRVDHFTKTKTKTLLTTFIFNIGSFIRFYRSHVCWHVLGLLHRSDRNYNEAIKAYKQALRIDPENIQILRDLSFLQIQMRDLDGFVTSRNQLLNLKSSFKINWMAFALARHLAGDLDGAIKVIDTYLSTLSEGSSELGRCFESSELALYRNSIVAEKPGGYKAALDHLGVVEGIVVDRGAWLMKRAEYELQLQDFVAAKTSALTMMKRGMTEDHAIHSLFMCAVLKISGNVWEEARQLKGTRTLANMIVLSDEQKDELRKIYSNELLSSFPKSHAVQRIPFSFMDIDELCNALEARCRKDIVRGVPSLCAELVSHIFIEEDGRYRKPTDPVEFASHPLFQRLVQMVDCFVRNLESSCKFHPEDETVCEPATLIWAWFLRAGLCELIDDFSQALVLIDKCLEKDSSIVDVYELKARLLRAAGDINAAAECLDTGRQLDLSDRYINNQTTKYLLQAGKEDEALKRISLFTRHDGKPERILYDMQCSWYELELAECLRRKGERGRSLKKYSAVVKHFEDFNEDQFDFHGYCLRKVTLRAYVNVLRYEDAIYGQDYFCRAASGMIGIYLDLADSPDREEDEEPDYASMTAAERKKAKAIARKKKRKSEADKEKKDDQAKKGANGDKGKQGKTEKPSFIDEDPNGEELLKKDPLEECKKFTSMLAMYNPKDINTWILRYDVAIRRNKVLICLQALHRAKSIAPDNSSLFARLIDFESKRHNVSGLSPLTAKILNEEAPSLVNNLPLKEYIKTSVARVQTIPQSDLMLRVEMAKAMVAHGVDSVAEAASLITKDGVTCRNASLASCQAALAALDKFGTEASIVATHFKSLLEKKFCLLTSKA